MSRSHGETSLWRCAIHVVLVAAATMGPAWAQEPGVAPSAGAVPPDAPAEQMLTLEDDPVISAAAQAVLNRMQATLETMKNYSVTAEITRDEALSFGYKLQRTEAATMWVQAPNNLRVEVKGDIKNRTYVYDGASLTTYSADDNVYATGIAPSTTAELVHNLLENGVELPLIDLLYSAFTGELTEDVRVGLVVGESIVDGVVTDHLAFRQPNVDWQLWVAKGAQALPRKLVITTRYTVGDPQYMAVLHWDTNAKTPAGSFAFKPPANAVKVPMRTDLNTTGGAK